MKVGDDYFDSADFQRLLSTYEKSINAGEPVFMDADELTDIADYYQYTERLDEAEKAISLALSLSPGAVAPLTYRIHEALYDGDTQKAWQLLDQIIETSEPDYIYDRAEILINEDKVDEAEQYLNSILETIEDEEERQDFIMDVVGIFSDNGLPDKTLEWMTKGHQENTTAYKELMARSLFEMEKFDESAKIFNQLVDSDPFSCRYWTALASAQFMNGEYCESVQSSEYAIAIDPNDPNAQLAKASALMRLENFEESLKFYERYLEQEPDDDEALARKGYCLTRLGRNEEALSVMRQAADIMPADSPNLVKIYEEIAFILMDMGRTDEAIAELDKTNDLDCDHNDINIVKGHILLTGKRAKEAKYYFAQGLLYSDDKYHAFIKIVVSLIENKFVEQAYDLLKELFSQYKEEDNGGYAYMAFCCRTLKKYEEYLEYLELACVRNPKECKEVLGDYFPNDVPPEEYYNYTVEEIKKRQ